MLPMRVQEYLILLELTLSKRTVKRRGLLPFAQGFACGLAGLSEFSLNSSLCCPCACSAFSGLRLSLGHDPNTRILQLRAFRDVNVVHVPNAQRTTSLLPSWKSE